MRVAILVACTSSQKEEWRANSRIHVAINPQNEPLDFVQGRKATTYGFHKKNVFNTSGIMKVFCSVCAESLVFVDNI